MMLAASIPFLLGDCRSRGSVPMAHAPLKIDRVRDWLQVCWLHTTRRIAKVIQFQPFRHRPNQGLIAEPMRVDYDASGDSEVSVSKGMPCAAPEPAAIRDLNLLPEPASQGRVRCRATGQGIAMPLQPEKVTIAQGAGFNLKIASSYAARFCSSLSTPTGIVHRTHRSAERSLGAIWNVTVGLHRKVAPFGVMRQAVTSGAAAFIIAGGRS